MTKSTQNQAMKQNAPKNAPTASNQANQGETPEKRYTEILVRNASFHLFNQMCFRQAVLGCLALGISLLVTTNLRGTVAPSQHIPTNGELQIIEPLQKVEHNKSDSEIATFVTDTLQATLSFDWFNVIFQTNQQVSKYTNSGWLSLKDNLERSGILQLVQEKRYILSFETTSMPIVSNKGVMPVNGENAAFWVVDFKGKLRFIDSKSGSTARTDNAEISVLVVRQSILESNSGVAINRTSIKFK